MIWAPLSAKPQISLFLTNFYFKMFVMKILRYIKIMSVIDDNIRSAISSTNRCLVFFSSSLYSNYRENYLEILVANEKMPLKFVFTKNL